MRIVRAQLRQFRNHDCTKLDFGAATNVLVGDNGHGKTNVLDGLSFLCLTKSFYAGSDLTALQKGKEFFEVQGTIQSDVAIEHDVRVVYDSRSSQKRFFIDGNEPESFSSVIGQFPIVVLSPENAAITFGAPVERRRFVDIVVAQSSRGYLQDMLEYRRALRQRNRILSEATRGAIDVSSLEPWDDVLCARGSKLFLKRASFFSEFAPYILRAYRTLAGETESPAVEYTPQIPVSSGEKQTEVEQRFRDKMAAKRREEFRLGTTLVGPHRDEVAFSLNGLQLRAYASQGQHKTFLVALKIAEFFYLKERCTETPVILLDDVFTELDEGRTRNLLKLIDSLGQTFITATDEHVLGNSVRWDDDRRKFSVLNGSAVDHRHEAAA
ncbi:MAG TPA: DNA replication and repair protein RecF [Bacteroidota bacterium]|nr:DNA replication and repair protein RecF [Bacteroidota bacterium]